jgi:hypothetical protein
MSLTPAPFPRAFITDFMQRLAVPYVFKNLFVSYPQQSSNILTRLSSNLSPGRHVRSLMYSQHFTWPLQITWSILLYMPYLSRIGPASCYTPGQITPEYSHEARTNWYGFEVLAERVGSNLTLYTTYSSRRTTSFSGYTAPQ